MPFADVRGIRIYYETYGDRKKEPLVFITGLGYPLDVWFMQIPFFSRDFFLVLPDNRGAGLSDKPKDPFTIKDMADDVKGVLDHLGVREAHIVGASMGGFIAQELAISYPDRVRKLVLICTHYGGPEYFQEVGNLWEEILKVEGLSPEEIYRRGIYFATSREFFEKRKDIVERLVKMRLEKPQPPYAFFNQFNAAVKFYAKDRLKNIKAPCLVVAGKEDVIVPLTLQERLAKALGAKFKVFDGGHMIFIEKADEVNREILGFLKDDC